MTAKKSAQAFESVSELATDKGIVGQALRRLPSWLLNEADRWDSPWTFLLGVNDIPRGFRQLFKAALSQRHALSRLVEVVRGAGSIKTSRSRVLRDALQNEDVKTARRVEMKIFAPMWQYDRGRILLARAEGKPDLQARIRSEATTLYAKKCRKLGRKKTDAMRPNHVFDTRDITHKIAEKLAWGWLRNSSEGALGFCFFSDKALVDTLQLLLALPELSFATVRKTRERLGLKKADLFIFAAQRNTQGLWEFSDRTGNIIAHETVPNPSTKVVRRPND